MDENLPLQLQLNSNEIIEGDTVNSLAKNVLKRVIENGYVHIQTPLSEVQFETLSKGIGSIELKTDILIDMKQDRSQQDARKVKGRPSAFQAKGFDFHMDCPDMRVMCWLCKIQDKVDGTMLMLDTKGLADHFSNEELEGLGKVMIRYSDLKTTISNEKFLLKPLVSFQNSSYLVYYQPWLLLEKYNEPEDSFLKKFEAYLKKIEKTNMIPIRPKKGESLFIDNRRLLHGRAKVGEQSNRHLLRLMLNVPEAAI